MGQLCSFYEYPVEEGSLDRAGNKDDAPLYVQYRSAYRSGWYLGFNGRKRRLEHTKDGDAIRLPRTMLRGTDAPDAAFELGGGNGMKVRQLRPNKCDFRFATGEYSERDVKDDWGGLFARVHEELRPTQPRKTRKEITKTAATGEETSVDRDHGVDSNTLVSKSSASLERRPKHYEEKRRWKEEEEMNMSNDDKLWEHQEAKHEVLSNDNSEGMTKHAEQKKKKQPENEEERVLRLQEVLRARGGPRGGEKDKEISAAEALIGDDDDSPFHSVSASSSRAVQEMRKKSKTSATQMSWRKKKRRRKKLRRRRPKAGRKRRLRRRRRRGSGDSPDRGVDSTSQDRRWLTARRTPAADRQ